MEHKNQVIREADNGPNGRAAALVSLAKNIADNCAALPPSSERTLKFVENVLRCPGADRLETLAIRAALTTIASYAGGIDYVVVPSVQPDSREQVEWNDSNRGRTLCCHTTSAVSTATIEEMVANRASEDFAHILFVTTDTIDPAVREYASSAYKRTGGIEFAILDCLGFVRHFLHLFHQHRVAFLDAYQSLVLNEPEGAVSFVLKRAFFSLLQVFTAPRLDE